MKFKLKKKYYKELIILSAIVFLGLIFTTSFYVIKTFNNKDVVNTVNVKGSKSSKILKYVTNNKDKIVSEVDINKEITNVITREENKYSSVIFNYESGEEISLESLIKDECIDSFWDRIKELIYLKYPKFIADVIMTNEGENVYYLKENELIIYFYNYNINPGLNEELFLKVNYNEIKDYLNITVNLDSEYQNEDGSVVNHNKKLIAITFDDGPGRYTSDLVDILNDNKAKATFFMLGKNILNYRDSVLKIYNNGMEIGYHSYAHTNFKRQEIDEIKSELALSNEYLKSITGETFKLIRPPYGSINEKIKNALDNPFIFWNIDTEDWRHKDTKYLSDYVLDRVSDGDIILFHDIHKSSVETMNTLLPLLYVNGFQVVTVSTLAKEFNTSLENHQVIRHFTR